MKNLTQFLFMLLCICLPATAFADANKDKDDDSKYSLKNLLKRQEMEDGYEE